MNFTSQICTTKEQSGRLLALGLKKDTSDMMYCKAAYGESITVKDDDYLEHLDFPAWSLHRLWELAVFKRIKLDSKDEIRVIYDGAIDKIEWLIKEGYFNKEYLE